MIKYIRITLIVSFLSLTFIACNTIKAQNDSISPSNLEWTTKVGAKKYPTITKTFNVKDYGAVADGKTMNTMAIQKAIDAAEANGGGQVIFDKGQYLTGSVFIKNGVDFHIGEGVILLGSQNIKDYPEINTRVAGIEMLWPAALVNVIEQRNASISGKGTIFAQGKVFWDYYWKIRKEDYDPKGLRWIVDYDAKRARTILISDSRDITLKDITVQQAGFWTVQVLYSSYVTVDGITIQNNIGGHGPSTDGIDIDSSSWILVQNCDIDCNDDNFCLKAGRDWDGLRVNRPTEYVVIKDCIARKGAGLLTCGSETSGGIRHIYASNIKGMATSNCLNIKSAFTRGGTVEDIHLENVTMDSVGTVLQVNMNWNPSYSYSELPAGYDPQNIPPHWKKLLMQVKPEDGTPTFKDIYMKNIHVKGARRAINVMGMENSYVQNVHFDNVSIEAVTAGTIRYSKNWVLNDFTLKTKDNSKVEIKDSEEVVIP
jgi:polygalacturonase